MRFLVDESVSWRVARDLREAGHDAVHVDQVQLLRASDEQVFERARSDSRHIITQDSDFEPLLRRSGSPTPSIVLLRRRDARSATQTVAILQLLPSVAAMLEAGAILVIFDDRYVLHRTDR